MHSEPSNCPHCGAPDEGAPADAAPDGVCAVCGAAARGTAAPLVGSAHDVRNGVVAGTVPTGDAIVPHLRRRRRRHDDDDLIPEERARRIRRWRRLGGGASVLLVAIATTAWWQALESDPGPRWRGRAEIGDAAGVDRAPGRPLVGSAERTLARLWTHVVELRSVWDDYSQVTAPVLGAAEPTIGIVAADRAAIRSSQVSLAVPDTFAIVLATLDEEAGECVWWRERGLGPEVARATAITTDDCSALAAPAYGWQAVEP